MKRRRRLPCLGEAVLAALLVAFAAAMSVSFASATAAAFVARPAAPTRDALYGDRSLRDVRVLTSAVSTSSARIRGSCHDVVSSARVCLALGVAGAAVAAAKARRTVARRANPWDMLQDAVGNAVGNAVQGTMADPSYWKAQLFLQSRLKAMLPKKEKIIALHMLPEDHVHLGYVTPDKDSGSKLEEYIAMGAVTEEVKKTISNQGQVTGVPVTFAEWQMTKKTGVKEGSIDVALLAKGAAGRIGSQLQFALTEIRRLLRYDGRLLIVADDRDEVACGGKFENILQMQDLRDVDELADLDGLDASELADGQVLRRSGLRLVRVVSDDCGLKIGICLPREEEKPLPKAARKNPAEAYKKKSSSQSGRRGGPAASAPGRRGGVASGRSKRR